MSNPLPDVLIDPEQIAVDTLEFVRIQSETGDEGAASHFLADLMRREGIVDVTLDDAAPGRPNVYGRIPGTGGGRALLFNGHTDTIPVGRSAPPARDRDWIVGRGAEDMKGGLVAMVHAAAALVRSGVRLAGDLWVTGVVDHETGDGLKLGPRRMIQRIREGELRPEAIIIVEGPCAIWSASLGTAVFELTLRSPRGPVHTLGVPFAENPARWAGKVLERFAEWETRFEAEGAHPLCGRSRVNVGIVQGGDYMNRVPTPLTITGQRRWTPGTTEAEVRAEFDALCAEIAAASGLTVEVAFSGGREPFETPSDHPVVRALRTASEQVSGAPAEVIGMALVGDANLYANESGVPTVYYGPAYETAHSDLERVSIRQLAHCAQVYALTALEFCGTAV